MLESGAKIDGLQTSAAATSFLASLRRPSQAGTVAAPSSLIVDAFSHPLLTDTVDTLVTANIVDLAAWRSPDGSTALHYALTGAATLGGVTTPMKSPMQTTRRMPRQLGKRRQG